MKRRTAIKHLGAGLSAGFLLPWLSSCSDEKVEPKAGYQGKIAVVGAGAAGLFAADYLLTKGYDVVVYEASSRIGGRVKTLRLFDKVGDGLWFNENAKLSSDIPVELGADRILGSDSAWAKYVNQTRFQTFPIGQQEDYRYWFKNLLQNYETASADGDFIQSQNFLNDLPTLTSETGSVQKAIQSRGITPAMYALLEAQIGNKAGTINSQIGTAAVATDLSIRTRASDELLISNNSMADVLIEGFIKASEKTELSTAIKEINYQGEKIVLSGERSVDGSAQPFTVEVDKVIITVPVSVLKAGDIKFVPELPVSKTNAMISIGMDTALRVVLDFRKNFWGNGFRTILGGESAPEYFNPGEGRSTVARTFNVTVSGTKAEQLSALGKDMLPVLLEELDKMYDGQATENVRRDATAEAQYIALIQDWGKEPFIKGSRSYLKPGGTNDHRKLLSTSVNKQLYFAGEATDYTGEAGTINGALLSAERAVEELLEQLT